jgi:prepilin-type N-terminal cleavage/methylation domain-containing protein
MERVAKTQRRPLARSSAGVTLVELMVVVAIIAIIAAIAITLYQDIQKKTKLAADQGTMAAVRSAITIYYGMNDGLFPGNQATVLALLQAPGWQCAGNSGWGYTAATGIATLAVNDVSGC